jgi:Mce-associated membrane protein
VVERRERDGHVAGHDAAGAGTTRESAVVVGERDDLEGEHGDKGDAGGDRDDAVREETAEHAGPIPRQVPVATWRAAIVLAVVAAVLGAVLWARGPSAADRRAEVVAVSERFAVALTSYDHRRLERDFARVRSMSLAGFRDEYDSLLGGQSAEALRASEAVSKATVETGPLVASMTDDEARTFTVVVQTVTNKENPEGQRVRTRVELYLVKTVAGWKIDRVFTTS